MKKVYLAGPIFGKNDSEALAWRERATEKLVCDVVNPAHNDFRGQEDTAFRQIVEGDKSAIDGCWAVLVNSPYPSYGTAMEILYAWERKKEVAIVAPRPWSPWLRYHSQCLTQDMDLAIRYLNQWAVK